MDVTPIFNDIFKFFQISLPPLFIGFLIANTLKTSSYIRYAGIPMNPIIRIAHLPSICASVLTLFFLSSWSGMGMLSHYYHEKKLPDHSILSTVMIAQFPKALNSVIFFQAPVALSILGLFLGGILICSELLLTFIIAIGGVIYGRLNHPIDSNSSDTKEDISIETNEPKLSWSEFVKTSLKGTITEFYDVAKIMIPFGAVLIIILDIGSNNALSFLDPVMQIIHLPSYSLIVIASAFVSQIAVLTSAGALADLEEVTLIQILIILFIARAIHLGIGYVKTSLPTNISLFGRTLGVRVTGLECILIESGLVIIIMFLIIIQWIT